MPIRKAKAADLALVPNVTPINGDVQLKIEKENLSEWTNSFVADMEAEVRHQEVRIKNWKEQILQSQVSMGRSSLMASLSKSAITEYLADMVNKIKTIPGVCNVTVGKITMSFTTDPIWVENTQANPVTKHFLGSYKVRVHQNGKIEFASLNKMPARLTGIPHPHTDEGVCLGGYQAMIGAAYSAFDYYNLVLVIMEYLRSVTLTDGRGRANIGKFPQEEQPLIPERDHNKLRFFDMFRDWQKESRFVQVKSKVKARRYRLRRLLPPSENGRTQARPSHHEVYQGDTPWLVVSFSCGRIRDMSNAKCWSSKTRR